MSTRDDLRESRRHGGPLAEQDDARADARDRSKARKLQAEANKIAKRKRARGAYERLSEKILAGFEREGEALQVKMAGREARLIHQVTDESETQGHVKGYRSLLS